jgi:hypothetical protein
MKNNQISRRRLLRGVLQGSAVAVGLPLLDVFLNENGSALASGAPMPLRFGTWFWGCGMNIDRFVPTTVGANYDLPPELQAIKPHRNDVSVFSGFNTFLDGAQNFCHYSGQFSILSGTAPLTKEKLESPTFDTAIAAAIGKNSRFRSIEVSASGNPRDSHSRPAPSITNPSEVSPVALYRRIFGAEFQDPNRADFKPDPSVMVRQSVLSAVRDEYKRFEKVLGYTDRQRMQQYFTSLRQTENRLALMLEKPAPAEACVTGEQPVEMVPASDVVTAAHNHKLFAELLAMAMACNQTRVVNMLFSNSFSTLRKPGTTVTHHNITHEEPIDPDLGYQPQAAEFVGLSIQAWAEFLRIMKSVPEGDGTLLDNSLILALSDTQFAKVHSLNSIPMMIAGKAGDRIKSGLHVVGNGDPVTRIGLTIQQVMGLSIDNFGTKSMRTQKPVSEILV